MEERISRREWDFKKQWQSLNRGRKVSALWRFGSPWVEELKPHWRKFRGKWEQKVEAVEPLPQGSRLWREGHKKTKASEKYGPLECLVFFNWRGICVFISWSRSEKEWEEKRERTQKAWLTQLVPRASGREWDPKSWTSLGWGRDAFFLETGEK